MLKSREGDAVKPRPSHRRGRRARRREGRWRRTPIFPPTNARDLARKIGIGAMKYADLSNDRIKDYVFDWNRMLAFEGNTAPYVMYCRARSHSIFRKGAVGSISHADLAIAGAAEHALAAALLRFGSTVRHVAESLEPHHLCGYLFEVAGLFATFYQACPVLQAQGATRRSRLALCELTARVLGRGLDLLGIEAPARM